MLTRSVIDYELVDRFKKQTKYENVLSAAFTYFKNFGKILNQLFTIEV